MENYALSIRLLGLHDQNLPLFKESRTRRLKSIEKMVKLINTMDRLIPPVPKGLFTLDALDPEWDDKMVYPVVNYTKYLMKIQYWGLITLFYGYNWNVLHSNRRLRVLANMYPFVSTIFLGNMIYSYNNEIEKVNLFENYCEVRTKELLENNKHMLEHEDYRKAIYFLEDMKETLTMVHRQANNHDSSDFKDSELLLQDFIRRYSDERNPEASLFHQDGTIKKLN